MIYATFTGGVCGFFTSDPGSPWHGSARAVSVCADEGHELFDCFLICRVIDDGSGAA